MMGNNLRKKFASPRFAVIFGIIFVISQVMIAYLLQPIGAKKVFELQTSLSSSFVRDTLNAWQANDMIYDYQRHYLLDVFHPIWYSLFLISVLSQLFVRYKISPHYDFFLFFPLLAGLLDLFENISHIFFISNASTISPIWVSLSGGAALLKWALVAICSLIIVGAVVLRQLQARSVKIGSAP